MPSLIRLTALALARALLAGAPTEDGLAARLRVCLDADAVWVAPLAERCSRIGREHWRRLTPRTLANWIERDPGYLQAWSPSARSSPFGHAASLDLPSRVDDAGVDPGPLPKPNARRHVLRERVGMNPLPLGLDRCQVPYWPHTAALAGWLDVPDAGMWRLTRPSAWQRRRRLGDQHYACRLLAKPSGGWRLLEVPHAYLMPLQRRLLDDLLDRIPPHEAAFGYTRERSVVGHARAHAGQAVVLRFDLQDFFTCIRASRVHALFTTLGYAATVAQELTALCTTATPEPVLRRMFEAGHLTWTQLQRLRDPHLPQGAPTSPALANLCAFGLDLRLEGLAHVLGARYTRYADDLVLSGGRHLRDVRQRIEAWVGHIAQEEGFTLNHRKTRCLSDGRRQTVCSIVVNQRPNLPRPEFDRLKAILHQCVARGPAAQNRDGRPQWRDHLCGRVAWAAQLNPAKAQKLQQLLARIDWSR